LPCWHRMRTRKVGAIRFTWRARPTRIGPRRSTRPYAAIQTTLIAAIWGSFCPCVYSPYQGEVLKFLPPGKPRTALAWATLKRRRYAPNQVGRTLFLDRTCRASENIPIPQRIGMSHVELTTAGSLCEFFQKLNLARCLDSDFFDRSNPADRRLCTVAMCD